MNIKYPRAKPYFSTKSKQKINQYFKEILNTGNLIQGKYVKEFEDLFAKFIGAKHAIATNSCTSALEIVVKSIGIKGKKILVPSQTFVATGNAVIASGNTPVFVDINKNTLCMSLESIKKNMSPDVAGIILVHIGGLITPEYYDIKSYCNINGLFLIEDSAHAIGSNINEKKSGTLGTAACFSFYPTKLMTTGEGGMITTDSEKLANLCRLYRNHGGDGTNFFYNSSNHRMTEISAAIGLAQLNEIDFFIKERNKIASTYRKYLSNITGIELLPVYEHIFNCYWNFYFILDDNFDRQFFRMQMLEYGIQTGDAYSPPCHLQRAFDSYINPEQDFSVTERILQKHVSLPMYVGMTEQDVEYICKKVEDILIK